MTPLPSGATGEPRRQSAQMFAIHTRSSEELWEAAVRGTRMTLTAAHGTFRVFQTETQSRAALDFRSLDTYPEAQMGL